MNDEQREKAKHAAKIHVPNGNGRELVESTFVAGYAARAKDEKEESAKTKEESRVTRRIFDVCNTLGFLMLMVVCFGQIPMEKAITAVTTKYKYEARNEVCDRIYEMKEVYSAHMREAFVSGCLWDLLQVNLTIYKKDKKGTDRIIKMFNDRESPMFQEFSNYCEKAAADMQVQGLYEERITTDLYSKFKCGSVPPRIDE